MRSTHGLNPPKLIPDPIPTMPHPRSIIIRQCKHTMFITHRSPVSGLAFLRKLSLVRESLLWVIVLVRSVIRLLVGRRLLLARA